MAFTTPNDRIFYACQAVLVVDRNTPTGDTAPTDSSSKYLTGVQSIGVNTSTPSSSLLDVGRFQRQFHYYDKQEIEINIERVIDIINPGMIKLICFFKRILTFKVLKLVTFV